MGGVSDFLASIDPGPAIGGALASVDKAVNKNIPGSVFPVPCSRFLTSSRIAKSCFT